MRPTLHIVLGPTAIGKTAYAIQLATALKTEIVSFDSRQFYQELDIGVARPSADELASANHHFIACRSITDPYNVYSYEQEALATLQRLFESHADVVAVGGSGLYADAICHGIAVLPDPLPGLREELQKRLQQEGIESLQHQLKVLDPTYYAKVDLHNPMRIQRALEVCLTSGRPYSQLLQQAPAQRTFNIKMIQLHGDPCTLRERINRRVDQMIDDGLAEEALRLLPFRGLQPLNTVGYKEFYTAWDQGIDDIELIAANIKTHTWQYAKKQITWLKKSRRDDTSIVFVPPQS